MNSKASLVPGSSTQSLADGHIHKAERADPAHVLELWVDGPPDRKCSGARYRADGASGRRTANARALLAPGRLFAEASSEEDAGRGLAEQRGSRRCEGV